MPSEPIKWLLNLGHFKGPREQVPIQCQDLLEALNIKGRSPLIVHVAGSNGKGSACAYIDAYLQNLGYRVGLFTSPHLKVANERIQINRQLISDADLALALKRVRQVAMEQKAIDALPFFTAIYLAARLCFAQHACDAIVLETGLGGRYDPTITADANIAVLTTISLEHQEILGPTWVDIAQQKAAIARPDRPFLAYYPEDIQVRSVIEEAVTDPSSSWWLKANELIRFDGQECHVLPDCGQIGYLNQAAQWMPALCCALKWQAPTLRWSALASGVHWPGRLQCLKRGQGEILIDGAHNPAAMARLVLDLKAAGHFDQDRPLCFVFCAYARPNWRAMLAPLESLWQSGVRYTLLTCPLPEQQGVGRLSMNISQVRTVLSAPVRGYTNSGDLDRAVNDFLSSADNPWVLACGSLHMGVFTLS